MTFIFLESIAGKLDRRVNTRSGALGYRSRDRSFCNGDVSL